MMMYQKTTARQLSSKYERDFFQLFSEDLRVIQKSNTIAWSGFKLLKKNPLSTWNANLYLYEGAHQRNVMMMLHALALGCG